MTAKRRIEYDGSSYAVRRDDVEVPDLASMDRLGALIWLNQNTYAKGRSTQPANPLAGYGDALTVKVS